MSHSVIPSHSRANFLEEVSELATKLEFKGNATELNDLNAEETPDLELNNDQLLRIQVMMRAPIEILQHFLKLGANPNYVVKGASTYTIAKAFGCDQKTLEVLEAHGARASVTKKPHSKN